MVEGFKVEVPITLKGGREGEKVGKQIGDKMAAQLQKTFRAINIGGGRAAGAGLGEAAGLLGVSKGLRGVATKLGAIGIAIAASVGLLSKASPYLKGILSIFGRAFMIFFRPFGDFLATLLRPLAILLMKMAVAFLKWTRPITGRVREAVEGVPQIPEMGNILADIPIQLANWLLQIGAAIGTVIAELGRSLWDLGTSIGEWLLSYVILPAGEYLSAKILTVWNWTKDFPGWLWKQITSIWTWGYDFGLWVWEKITSIWLWEHDYGGWIWGKITSIWSWKWDFGSWLWGKIRSIGGSSFGGRERGEGQVGIPFVPGEGLYKLHRGEEVVSRTGAGTSRSIIFKPTFQISGDIAQDIDIDAVIRRAGRITETDLKQRGII